MKKLTAEELRLRRIKMPSFKGIVTVDEIVIMLQNRYDINNITQAHIERGFCNFLYLKVHNENSKEMIKEAISIFLTKISELQTV